jgi:transposase
MEATTIGLDLAEHVFQAHGASASGAIVFRKRLRREQVLLFFAAQPRCVVAMEACASAHYWGREIGKLGHEVRLIPPAYVKPFVKRQKNDMADAEAICEAAATDHALRGGEERGEAGLSGCVPKPRSAGGAANPGHQRHPRSYG